MSNEEVVMEGYWVEIPCMDKEAATRLALHLEYFKPRITVHRLIKNEDGTLRSDHIIVQGDPELLPKMKSIYLGEEV